MRGFQELSYATAAAVLGIGLACGAGADHHEMQEEKQSEHAAHAGGEDTIRKATLRDREGRTVGEATLRQTPHGVLIQVGFEGLIPGTHAFHLHETGECERPFTSAGGHFDPHGVAHGLLDPDGAHQGDLPNIHVPSSGDLTLEILAPGVQLEGEIGLMDADGAALVVHEGPDDYASDPAGAAGPRLACGVIE